MQIKPFCGVDYYYSDDLFLGDEKRSICPFVEYFLENDRSNLFCNAVCHIAGMVDDNPAEKCGGDPWKCPIKEGALIKQHMECERLLKQAVDGVCENWSDWMKEATKTIYGEKP